MSPGVNFDLVKLVLSLSHKKKKKKPFKGETKMKQIPVVCFQFLYSEVKLKQFVCANRDKSNLAHFERASFKQSLLSCVHHRLLYPKQSKTFPGEDRENKGQQCCFWATHSISSGLILSVHELITQKRCFTTMWRGAPSPLTIYNHWLLCARLTSAAVYSTSDVCCILFPLLILQLSSNQRRHNSLETRWWTASCVFLLVQH